jgi:hypothetical protein
MPFVTWVFGLVVLVCGFAGTSCRSASLKSVGRGAPDPMMAEAIVGSEGKGYFTGAGVPADNMPVFAARDGATPPGVEPLKIDIFSSKDFYKDKALWFDPRYYRCNSSVGLEQIWGAYEVPLIGDNPPATAAWGYCDRDYPRDQIVSPYPFKTAKAHYAALLDEARARGGPTVYTQATLPDWNGQYLRRRDKRGTWFNGAILQIPTYLSLLKPTYQQRFVQQMYHYAASNSPQWPGSYCWPEGFMRRLAQYGGARVNLVMTPDLILDMRVAAKTLVTQIHIGREFKEDGGASPHLGVDAPEWLGDTIGFWDGDALVTWTSHILGWMSHGAHEFSGKLQTIEIYTPLTNADGKRALRHEIVLYDDDVFVDPVRIVHYLDKQRNLNEGEPLPMIECVPQIFPVKGNATRVLPGQTFEHTLPDVFGRPWAAIWERYHEKGMERPDEDILDFLPK